MKPNSFKNSNILITGASSGIGEAFARALANKGANLILTARSEDKLIALSKELMSGRDIWVKAIPSDLSQDQGAQCLFDKVQDLEIQVDILINNAGFGKWNNFTNEEFITYRKMLSLNINSLVELTYLFLPQMLERNMGGVINTASTAAFQPVPFQAVYASSKAFVLHFTEALAGEFSHTKLRLLALCPGHTETNFMKVANANPSGMPSATPDYVVDVALRAYSSKCLYRVTGFSNYLYSLIPRFITRRCAVRIVANMFRNRILNSSVN